VLPLPERGRRFTGTRTVRLGDAGLDGALRLDALARFLQDLAADDAHEVGLRAATWVVRRTTLEVDGRPAYGDRIELTTFCGGLGSRWAERRTSVVGPSCRIEASSIWVHLDEQGRPAPLPPVFLDAYTEAAGGRTVSSRLTLPSPPSDPAGTTPPAPWPVLPTDFDVLGHVNNAVYWSLAEDAPLARGRLTLEYRTPIEPGVDVALVEHGHLRWLVRSAGTHAALEIEPMGDR
jgi:acyl-ACP thioesterase